jgi:hypothetical protein
MIGSVYSGPIGAAARGVFERTLGGPAFEIPSLFKSGELGAWYDLSDSSTLWQNTAASTPVTSAGQPIARVNDKSGNGNNWIRLSTDAQRPVWNGSDALETDGINNWLYSSMAWSSAWTIVAALRGLDANNSATSLLGRGSFNKLGGLSTTNKLNWFANAAGNQVVLEGAADPTAAPFVFSTRRVSDALQNFGYNAQKFVQTVAPTATQQTWLTIGAQDAFGVGKRAVRCWQFLAINRALTDDELINVERQFAAKAGVSLVPQGGYDVFVVAGQSNAYYGSAFDSGLDAPDPNVYEFEQSGLVKIAQDPLDTFVGRNAGYIGFAVSFAKAYQAANPSRKVLLVHCTIGGTGFTTSSPNTWAAGAGSLRERTINRANAALAFAGNSLKGILWHQGESDEALGSSYATAIDGLINDFRSGITGAASVPFVAGGLGPAWVGSNTNRVAVQAALSNTPSRHAKAGYADSYAPTQLALSDGLHFTAAAQREFGARYYAAYLAALSDA